jgi:hypothetical protein
MAGLIHLHVAETFVRSQQLPLDLAFCYINAVHILTTYLPKIRFNIIIPFSQANS